MTMSVIKQQISSLESKLRDKGVNHVAVFGSRARGDGNHLSDLDLLLDLKEGASFSLIDLVGVEAELSEVTGLPANVFLRRSLEEYFYDSIRPDIQTVF
jgi:uncharacterized protein